MLPFALCAATGLRAQGTLAPTPNIAGKLEHPLRYRPDRGDFVIRNGSEYFNRPLYGGNTAFRVDAGDRPQFLLYLPGRGGNLRLGIRARGATLWLDQARQITARYRPGLMLYEIEDPVLGRGAIDLEAVALDAAEGLIVRLQGRTLPAGAELVWAFGGASGKRGARDGDIGTERVPISQYFQLTPQDCAGNRVEVLREGFVLHGRTASLRGLVPPGSVLAVGDARQWSSPEALLASAAKPVAEAPVLVGHAPFPGEGQPLLLGIQRLPDASSASAGDLEVYREVGARPRDRAAGPGTSAVAPAAPYTTAELPEVFDKACEHFRTLRERVRTDTPDPYLDAAVGALAVAADAVWDEPQGDIMHGAIAWRTRLLGWRGPYALDDLGWHDRARRHFEYWAGRQNLSPIPDRIPPPDEAANLSRNEAALHSNGDLSHSHYDMNLVYVDALFRHLAWTGDVGLARKLWPVIARHLAWERRLFRRTFAPDQAPLYDAYAAIWASDDLEYEGGGVAHSSAYNALHERLAAQLAPLAGADPAPYAAEADALGRAMRRLLWLPDRGWYAEFKDSLGLQLVHPAAGAWTVYHAIDSGVATPLEAWQLTRYADTALAHLPVRGPGVPSDQAYAMLASTDWMPYSWSVNNVVVGETVHTALAYWQAGRPEDAYRLLKGSLLASMYLGICPGNVGTMTYLDVYRRESQRDFADGAGVLSRAVVEGLFGVQPDLLHGRLLLRPGLPAAWKYARLDHPDLSVAFHRAGRTDTYAVALRFPGPVALRLELAARRDAVAQVLVDGATSAWTPVPGCVGEPRLAIEAAPGTSHTIAVTWRGDVPDSPPDEVRAQPGATAVLEDVVGLTGRWDDPQGVLAAAPQRRGDGCRFVVAAGAAEGHRTVFAQVRRGSFEWWLPVSVQVLRPAARQRPFRWDRAVSPTVHYDTLDLSPLFNDRVTEIFRHAYRNPRWPGATLAIPAQGIGGWAGGVHATAEIDDTGLRDLAGRGGGLFRMPSGLPFATPGPGSAPNIAFVSQWDNFPRQLALPLAGRARRAFLLTAGSTNWMQSRLDNAEIVVTYADGSTARLALDNPGNWWPVDQDYFIDDYQFARPGPLPPRVDLKTGRVRLLEPAAFKGQGRAVPGGAATVLELPLDATKPLRSLTLRALANEVVVGLMAVTLERP